MPDTMFMKERMLITGGHALQGTVHISGGKNTAVAVIPATLLCDEPCTIENLPDISDAFLFRSPSLFLTFLSIVLPENVS